MLLDFREGIGQSLRVRDGPYDTHTAVTHPLAPRRIYSAAGDGYFEGTNAADSWSSPEDGVKHLYLVGVVVDPADPDTVIVSATDGPGFAYSPRRARVVRLSEGWAQQMAASNERPAGGEGHDGEPFTTHAGEPGVIYAAKNGASSDQMMQDGAGRCFRRVLPRA